MEDNNESGSERESEDEGEEDHDLSPSESESEPDDVLDESFTPIQPSAKKRLTSSANTNLRGGKSKAVKSLLYQEGGENNEGEEDQEDRNNLFSDEPPRTLKRTPKARVLKDKQILTLERPPRVPDELSLKKGDWSDFLSLVLESPSSTESSLNNWYNRFRLDQDEGMKEIVKFVLELSGSQTSVQDFFQVEDGMQDLVQQMNADMEHVSPSIDYFNPWVTISESYHTILILFLSSFHPFVLSLSLPTLFSFCGVNWNND